MPNLYIARDGQTFGPYDEETAKMYVRSSQLLTTDLACYAGEKQWSPLATLLGITPPPPPQSAKKKGTHPLTMLAAIFGIPIVLLWAFSYIGSGVEKPARPAVSGGITEREKTQLGAVLSMAKTKMADNVRKGIAEKKVVVGMSQVDVINIWGQPSKKSPIGNDAGEQWNYSGGSWAMFASNGMLVGFKEN